MDYRDHEEVQEICDGVEADDLSVMEDGFYESLELFWLFISKKNLAYQIVAISENKNETLEGKVVKYQIKTSNRCFLQATTHYGTPKHGTPCRPVPNLFLESPVGAADVEPVREIPEIPFESTKWE